MAVFKSKPILTHNVTEAHVRDREETHYFIKIVHEQKRFLEAHLLKSLSNALQQNWGSDGRGEIYKLWEMGRSEAM